MKTAPPLLYSPVLSFLASFLFLVSTAPGATRFWDGSANGNFSTAANWVGDVAPVAGDDLVFQIGISRLLVTNDFSPNRAWSTLLFQGSNYFVRGNPILVTNGIASINPVGTNTVDADIDVRGSQPWEAQGALSVFDFNGDINLNANTLTVRANTGDFFLSGAINGTGNLVKTNVGTLRMDGVQHNTYSGFTRFDGGVLELNRFSLIPLSNYVSIPGPFTIGDGNDLIGTDVCRLLADDQIANTAPVTVRNSGILDLNDQSDRIGTLTMRGGTITTGSGVLTLGGNVNTVGDDNTAVINGQLSLGGSTRTFDIGPGTPAADMRINASIRDDAAFAASVGLIKTGAGTMFLTATNTYNGLTTINEGQLAILHDRALGDTVAVFGNPGTVINGDGNLFLSNVQITNEQLTINGTNPGGAFNASGASVWTGDITLNSATFIASSGSLLLNGDISGVGGFTKLSTGSLTLGGTNANTYSGTTTVRDGSLFLDKNTPAATDAALAGPLVIGEDELPENTDIVRFLRCCQTPDDTDVTINASGLLDLNGFGSNVGDIVFNGGDIDTLPAGSILPTGNITVNANTNSQAVIDGRMSVLSNPSINVTGHFFSPDISIPAVLHGAGGFTKNGVGELALLGNNTYTGQTIVNDGLLLVDSSTGLGSTAGGTVVNSGAVLGLRFDVAVGAEPLSLIGTGQGSFGALSSSFGSNSWAGNITLTGDATIYVDPSDQLNLSGSISGAFDITKTGTGTLILSGGSANSFSQLNVNSGTVALDKTIANGAGPADLVIGDGVSTDIVQLRRDNQIGDTTDVHITLGARLDLNDMLETTGSIDGRGMIDLGSGTLREGADNGSAIFSGLMIGTGNLFKLGTGSWTIDGNNTYSGVTTVSAGTLQIDGSQPQSQVIVNGTATLAGSGVIGNLNVFGSVRPGTSPGVLTCSNVAFTAMADYFVDLNGPAPGSGYDQLNVRGTNQLGSSTLNVIVGPGFAPVEGAVLTIINNDGSEAIQGTFAGLPQGSIFTAGGLQFRILYSDIFINDVLLVVTNTVLKLGGDPMVTTGNGNDEIEPGECNLLRIPLMNKIGGIVSGVTATLSSTNPGVTITQPDSTYPNLPANGMRTNNTPFQISTAPSLLCGTNIDLLLTVHTATNGSFSIPFRLYAGAAGTPVRFNQNTDLAVPDVGTVESTLTVAAFAGPVARVGVSLYLTHTAVGDLSLSLVAPDGSTNDLSSGNGSTGDDFGTGEADADRTVFSELALMPITGGAPPFRGTFRPEQPFSVYRGNSGSDVNGVWRLRITDSAGGSLGTLRAWSLFLSPMACSPGGGECDPPCPACPVQLNIARNASSPNSVVLSWSTAFVGYNLVATNAVKNPPNAWAPAGPAPVVVGSKYTVTNAASGTARFYELRKP